MGADVVFVIFCGLVVSVPALLFFQSLFGPGIILIIAGLAVAFAAETSPFWDRQRLQRHSTTVLSVGLASTFFLMLLQTLPLPDGRLVNPIWSMAAAAIGQQMKGSITIDTGATVLAICTLTGLVAVALLASLLGQHRRRAERLLSVLAGITTLVSIELIASTCWPPEASRLILPVAQGAAETISIFGFVLATAVLIHRYETARPPRSKRRKPKATVGVYLTASVACLINLGAVACGGNPATLFASLFGAGVLLAVFAIRRGRLGRWGQGGTAAMLALALVAFQMLMPGGAENEIIARMTEDSRLFGAGAGAFTALAPIYGDTSMVSAAVPTAAKIAVEMGRPFLWLITLVAVTWAAIMMQASLIRGRDYVYPATAAGCMAALLLSAQTNGGSLAVASSIILSSVLGLAIAQSTGELAISGTSTSGMQSVTAHDRRSPKWDFRGALAAFALILTVQGAWILLPEAMRPPAIEFPGDQSFVAVQRQDGQSARKAAASAAVRGDLWAESAFTEGAMVWTDEAFELETTEARNAATAKSLITTLHYAPHRGDAWLMLNSTCNRLKLPVCNKGALLKMSFYTAPNQPSLMPLRLAQALRDTDFQGDDELIDMVRRDIRLVITQLKALRPALISAYRLGSPAGRRLVEQTVTPIDPDYLTMLPSQLTSMPPRASPPC